MSGKGFDINRHTLPIETECSCYTTSPWVERSVNARNKLLSVNRHPLKPVTDLTSSILNPAPMFCKYCKHCRDVTKFQGLNIGFGDTPYTKTEFCNGVKRRWDVDIPNAQGKDVNQECNNRYHNLTMDGIPDSHVQLFLSSVATLSACLSGGSNKGEGEIGSKFNSVISSQNAENEFLVEASQHDPGPDRNARGASLGFRKKARVSPRKKKNRDKRSRLVLKDRGKKSVPASSIRPFKCHKCLSSFDREGHLRVHILAVHEKKRPFTCHICTSAFGHSSSLLRHVRTVHQATPAEGSGRLSRWLESSIFDDSEDSTASGSSQSAPGREKYFQCNICPASFSRVAVLDRHVASKHPSESQGSEDGTI